MVIGHLIGASLITYGVVQHLMNTPAREFKRNLELFLTDGCKLKAIKRMDYGYDVKIILPTDLPYEKFEKQLELLEQNMYAQIQSRHVTGRIVELKFGTIPLTSVAYNHDLPLQSLSVPLATPYGLKLLDFRDETSCHLLVGGATRMGKTVLLRLIATHLIRTTEGKIKIVFCDNKITDLYMFRNIPQVAIAESQLECAAELEKIVKVIEDRKKKLKENYDCVDLKQYREKHPNDPVDPIFIIIDEYGRYADNDDIQSMITFIAETAGYLDVHLVISAQRPDASEVLDPRIKANIVTRIAFSTSDATNSNIILGSPHAAHLGRIQGRAILLDGVMYTVQVPYLSPDYTQQLLQPYYKKVGFIHDGSRSVDYLPIEEIPNHDKGSNSPDSLPGRSESSPNREPYLKEIIKGLTH